MSIDLTGFRTVPSISAPEQESADNLQTTDITRTMENVENYIQTRSKLEDELVKKLEGSNIYLSEERIRIIVRRCKAEDLEFLTKGNVDEAFKARVNALSNDEKYIAILDIAKCNKEIDELSILIDQIIETTDSDECVDLLNDIDDITILYGISTNEFPIPYRNIEIIQVAINIIYSFFILSEAIPNDEQKESERIELLENLKKWLKGNLIHRKKTKDKMDESDLDIDLEAFEEIELIFSNLVRIKNIYGNLSSEIARERVNAIMDFLKTRNGPSHERLKMIPGGDFDDLEEDSFWRDRLEERYVVVTDDIFTSIIGENWDYIALERLSKNNALKLFIKRALEDFTRKPSAQSAPELPEGLRFKHDPQDLYQTFPDFMLNLLYTHDLLDFSGKFIGYIEINNEGNKDYNQKVLDYYYGRLIGISQAFYQFIWDDIQKAINHDPSLATDNKALEALIKNIFNNFQDQLLDELRLIIEGLDEYLTTTQLERRIMNASMRAGGRILSDGKKVKLAQTLAEKAGGLLGRLGYTEENKNLG